MLSRTIQLFSGDQLLSLLLTLHLSLAQFHTLIGVLPFLTAIRNETAIWGALLGIAAGTTLVYYFLVLLRISYSKCSSLYSWVSYFECPTPYSWVSYSECPTTCSRVSYSECPIPYRCALFCIDTIRSPASYKIPTPVGARSCTCQERHTEDMLTLTCWRAKYGETVQRIFTSWFRTYSIYICYFFRFDACTKKLFVSFHYHVLFFCLAAVAIQVAR